MSSPFGRTVAYLALPAVVSFVFLLIVSLIVFGRALAVNGVNGAVSGKWKIQAAGPKFQLSRHGTMPWAEFPLSRYGTTRGGARGGRQPVDVVAGSMNPPSLEGLGRLTHLIYALHAFSAVMGVISSAAVVTAFLTGWPSILAVILNYAKRSDVRGTYLESHFRWQIRTFWFAVLWVVIAGVLVITIIGIPLAWIIVVITGLWVLYRIVRGWLALNDGRPIDV